MEDAYNFLNETEDLHAEHGQDAGTDVEFSGHEMPLDDDDEEEDSVRHDDDGDEAEENINGEFGVDYESDQPELTPNTISSTQTKTTNLNQTVNNTNTNEDNVIKNNNENKNTTTMVAVKNSSSPSQIITPSKKSSNPIVINSHHENVHNTSSSSQADILSFDDDEDERIEFVVYKLDVGGEIFFTTLETLSKAGGQLAARFTGNWKRWRQKDGSYFIDRDPHLFRYVLEYLRTSELCWDNLSVADLKRLQLEADFFGLDDFGCKIKNLINPPLDLSWIDDDCEFGGIRDIAGSNIAFITAKQITWSPDVTFDTPEGYKWATMAEVMSSYEKCKYNIQRVSNDAPVYPAWGVEGLGWSRYTKDGMKRLFFIFADTAKTRAFIPSGKNLVSTSKVWKTFDETREYCEQRGLNFRHCQIKDNHILRGFGGIVCIKTDFNFNDVIL